LLSDLASDGGAVLFIDNLDLFGDDEQRTVIDLVREAANVPGLAVIATARRNFGVEEPNWLPADALDRFGRTEAILIGELTPGFAPDSPLEGGVSCELVSENAKFPASREFTGNFIDSGLGGASEAAKKGMKSVSYGPIPYAS
jgi:hypothetical protein